MAFACLQECLSLFWATSIHAPFFLTSNQHGGVISLPFGLSEHSER
jgi:hypothetical protein